MSNTSCFEYIGRFAPSPTGPLHLGSLYTALASFLHARTHKGKWLLRIDDLDSYRNVAGAAESIIKTLESYGLHWDGPIHYQSDYLEVYQTVITELNQQGVIYPCICTRKALAKKGFSVYPGFCRKMTINNDSPHSLRIKSNTMEILFADELQGPQCHQLAQQHGDFIVKRKDHIIAYQLAVVIDDHRQNISHVIRGFDLLDSTPKQIFLQQTLGYLTPKYCHVPIITDHNDHKLSKQTFAQEVSNENPQNILYLLLRLLNQNPPAQLNKASVTEIINWGIEHWQLDNLKKIRAIKGVIY